jgi:hypothetical protein
MNLLSQIMYSCKTLYVFWDGLSVNQQELKTAYTATVYVKLLLLPAPFGDEMELRSINIKFCTYFVLFCYPSKGASSHALRI